MAWFAEGGVGMYLVLASGVLVGIGGGLALIVAIAGWFFRPLRVVARLGAILMIVACILPMVVGVIGSTMARNNVRRAVELADPAQRELIIAVGNREASLPTMFGAGTSCCVLLPTVLASIVALTIPAPSDDEDED
ncbi:MAG: hypothetical protein R3F59_12635 [Myxococcota bacterium]